MIMLTMDFHIPLLARKLMFRGEDGKLSLDKINAYYDGEPLRFVDRFPGLIWKVWAVSEDGRRGSGYYLFDCRENAELRAAYARKHFWRKGITGLRIEYRTVLEDCSRATRAPIDLPANPHGTAEERAALLRSKS